MTRAAEYQAHVEEALVRHYGRRHLFLVGARWLANGNPESGHPCCLYTGPVSAT